MFLADPFVVGWQAAERGDTYEATASSHWRAGWLSQRQFVAALRALH